MELIDLKDFATGFALRFILFFAIGFLFTMLMMLLSEFCKHQPKPEEEKASCDPQPSMLGERFNAVYLKLNREEKIKLPLLPAFGLHLYPVNMFALMMSLLFTVLSMI